MTEYEVAVLRSKELTKGKENVSHLHKKSPVNFL